MKKRIITVAGIAACLALWAAVWPQKQPAEENTPALPTPVTVIATQHEVPKTSETEKLISPEEEKSKATLPELIEEADIAPEPSPAQTPSVSEVPVPSVQDATPPQKPEPAPTPDSAPDNMVYVPGFGWIENQGSNHVEYAKDMYENGNKIGNMG